LKQKYTSQLLCRIAGITLCGGESDHATHKSSLDWQQFPPPHFPYCFLIASVYKRQSTSL